MQQSTKNGFQKSGRDARRLGYTVQTSNPFNVDYVAPAIYRTCYCLSSTHIMGFCPIQNALVAPYTLVKPEYARIYIKSVEPKTKDEQKQPKLKMLDNPLLSSSSEQKAKADRVKKPKPPKKEDEPETSSGHVEDRLDAIGDMIAKFAKELKDMKKALN